MREEINRRHFLGAAAMTLAATQLGMIGAVIEHSTNTRASEANTMKTGPLTSLGPLKQVDAGVLNVGYVASGPANGPAVLLLHGWPFDIHSYVDVAPLPAARGYRVIVQAHRHAPPNRCAMRGAFAFA